MDELTLRVLPALNQLLRQSFLCGDEFSLLDVLLYCEITTIMSIVSFRLMLPLTEWIQRLELISGFKQNRLEYESQLNKLNLKLY